MSALTSAQIDAILDRLFTNGQGERADRLVLAQDLATPDEPKYKDLGGWSRAAVRQILVRALAEAPLPVHRADMSYVRSIAARAIAGTTSGYLPSLRAIIDHADRALGSQRAEACAEGAP